MQIKLLDVNKFLKGLTPVTSTELRTRSNDLHPDGLFSEKIFGLEETLDRFKKYSFINLNAYVVHPTAYRILIRLDRKLEKFFSAEQSFSFDNGVLTPVQTGGITGITKFIKIFPDLKFKGETSARDKLIKVIKESYKNGTLFIDKLPIVPPASRPMFQDEKGEWLKDELNDVYLGVMRKASQMKTVGAGPLKELLNFGLQKAVLDHDQFIRTKISKKSGIIRENLLGKRVDYSSRAVITPGPQLKVHEIGIPFIMAVTLFQPFLIHHLLFSKKFAFQGELANEIKSFTESELSVDTVNRVIKSIKGGDKIPKVLYDILFDATELVMKGRVVLAKRDPALHDGSYSAFHPILIHGVTVQICTLQVTPFNADFDGDQMAIFHPLTKQAQDEAKEKMMRAVGSKNSRSIRFNFSKEMCVGLYMMTKNVKLKKSPIAVTQADLEKANDPYTPVRFKGKSTTMGKAIFNSVFPPNFRFIDAIVTKKVVNGLIPEVINKYGEDAAVDIFSNLEKIGFKFATITGASITLDMIDIPASILRLKAKLDGSTTEEADKLLKEMKRLLIQHLKGTGMADLIDSGGGAGYDQPMQILVAKGIIADPKGNILPPIKGSFAEGLTSKEFFNAASGSRKGLADRTLNTADTGYFTRQLVYVLSPVEASPSIKDCKTKRVTTVRLTGDIISRLSGRYIMRGTKLVEFKPSDFKAGDVVRLRTPIYCESKKICHTCYGELLKRHKSPYIGIIAGTSIGERGTQLIMRTFHTGGAVTLAAHDVLQNIIDNDPLIELAKSGLSKYMVQQDDKVVALEPCKITLDLSNYKIGDTIQINEDFVWVSQLLTRIEFPNLIFNMILDYPIHIQKQKMETVGNDILIFNYLKNDVIIEVPLEKNEIKDQVNYVHRLLGGKVVYKDPSHLVNKILNVYGKEVSDLDLVHFEILISQTLRDKKQPILPARLGKTWDPIMMNIKNDVFASGFIQGLAFENINKAIETGLITEEEVEPSILGKLLTGDLVK